MKKTIPVLILFLVCSIIACKKNNFHNTEDHVGISRVTHFATFQMTGSKYIAVVKGNAYVEPGIKALEGTTPIQVTTTGTVDTSTPGLYVLTYSATNKDGFIATTSRNVIVIAAHENPGVDLSGKYDYVGSSTFTATVTKVAEGTYTTDNAWSGLTVIPIIFVSLDGLTLSVPTQTSAFGPIQGSGTYNPVTKRLIYVLTLPTQGINNSKRNWQRQ